jgi:hypothetical protein
MLKTTLEKTAKPSNALIMLGIMSGYIRNPLINLLKIKLASVKIKKKLSNNLPDDVKDIISLVISLYLHLKKCMDAATALLLTKAIILPIGLVSQMSLFRYVEEPDHSFENLITQAKQFKAEGPMRLNKSEIVGQSEMRYEFRVRNCIFKAVFSQFNCPELLGVFCTIDNATYNIYSPDKIVFNRGGQNKTIANGNKYCHFICEKVNI